MIEIAGITIHVAQECEELPALRDEQIKAMQDAPFLTELEQKQLNAQIH